MDIVSIKKVSKEKPENGFYHGLWGGHKIEFYAKDGKLEIETEIGVKGINVPVDITVSDNKITFEMIK